METEIYYTISNVAQVKLCSFFLWISCKFKNAFICVYKFKLIFTRCTKLNYVLPRLICVCALSGVHFL